MDAHNDIYCYPVGPEKRPPESLAAHGLISTLSTFIRWAWERLLLLPGEGSQHKGGTAMSGKPKTPLSVTEEVALLDLQLQALEIIEEIMSGTDPAEAGARASLSLFVDRNPGQPQRALLLHMLSTRRTNLS